MIITDQSEVFQKLLKDVEYIKSALTFGGKYYIGCDPIEEQKPKEEFKVGDWVFRIKDTGASHHRYGYIFRINKVDGSQIYEKSGVSHFASSLRHATKKEIEEHLITEAIKRGIKGWC